MLGLKERDLLTVSGQRPHHLLIGAEESDRLHDHAPFTGIRHREERQAVTGIEVTRARQVPAPLDVDRTDAAEPGQYLVRAQGPDEGQAEVQTEDQIL